MYALLIYSSATHALGLHRVYLDSAKDPFQVYCDMVSCGRDESNEWKEKSGCGGWYVCQLELQAAASVEPIFYCCRSSVILVPHRSELFAPS